MDSPSMLAPSVTTIVEPSSSPVISRFYIPVKAHYFLFFAAFGILYPVLNITLRSRGLSNTELSYINIIIPFLIFFTNPIMGFIADHTRRYSMTFNIILGICTISYGLIFILPAIKSRNIKADMIYDDKLGRVLDFCASQEVATKCASRSECGCTYRANCTFTDHTNENQITRFFFPFSMNSKDIYKEIKDAPDVSIATACGIEYRVPIDEAIKQYTQNRSLKHFFNPERSSELAVCEITCSIAHYCHGSRYPNQMRYILLYAFLFVLGTNCLTNSISVGVSLGFAALHRPDIFGQQRLWGTIGFGIFAFAASRAYEFFQTEFVYIIMFVITTVICIILTSFIPIQPSKRKRSVTFDENIDLEDGINESSVTKTTKKKSQLKLAAFLPLLKQMDVIIFLSLTFIWGMSYAVLDPYLYLYIDEIAPCQSRSVVGWMSIVAATAEVVAFFIAARVLKLFGANMSSVIILLAFAVRFAGYYFIHQPYFLSFMETMHFFNFGILYVLIAQKTDSIAPPGLSGTLQGVALGMTFGLGRGIGLLFSSFIYTLIQQRLLFLIFAVFNLIIAIIYGILFFIQNQRSKKSIEEKNGKGEYPPKVVIESDVKLNEEPLLVTSMKNKPDDQITEQ